MVTKHGADHPVPCSCFPLAIYFTFGSVYMSILLSYFIPAYPSSSPCPQVHSLRLCLYSYPAPRFITTSFFFRFHMYVLTYGICFSLSDLLYSVWQTLGPSTLLQITQFHPFLWLSNIPLYICATSSLPIFICWWTFWLLPCLRYCKECCSEHWGRCVFSIYAFLQICTQEWTCWIIW